MGPVEPRIGDLARFGEEPELDGPESEIGCCSCQVENFFVVYPLSDRKRRVGWARCARWTRTRRRIPAVDGLFLPSRPTTILTIVRAVVIETVDGSAFVPTGFHISNKGVERIRPLGTHRYAPRPVRFKIGMLRIKTTPLYVVPTLVENCPEIRRSCTHYLYRTGVELSNGKKREKILKYF
jgi:hypothetical protein